MDDRDFSDEDCQRLIPAGEVEDRTWGGRPIAPEGVQAREALRDEFDRRWAKETVHCAGDLQYIDPIHVRRAYDRLVETPVDRTKDTVATASFGVSVTSFAAFLIAAATAPGPDWFLLALGATFLASVASAIWMTLRLRR